MNSETQASDGPGRSSPLDAADALGAAQQRLRQAREKRAAYSGDSEHVRRKLDAALRSAEYDVAILKYAVEEA